MKKLIIFLALIISMSTFGRARIIARLQGDCIRVADGDTITVLINNDYKIKVRFLGIDAPESSRYRYGYIEKYGRIAKRFVKQLLLNRRVKLITFRTRSGRLYKDRYGRLLAYVYQNNIDVCKLLLLRGLAKVYRKSKCTRYYEFIRYERKAKRLRIGIWR